MVRWFWSADTLFWQLSIDHNMDVCYQVIRLQASILARKCDILYWLSCGADGRANGRLRYYQNFSFLLWGSAHAPFALAWISAITTYLNIMSLQSAFTIKEPGRREVEVVTVYNQLPYSVVKFFYQLFLTFTRRYRDRYWMQFHLLFLYRIILTLVNCFSATDSSLTNPHGLYSYRQYPLNDVKMFKTQVVI